MFKVTPSSASVHDLLAAPLSDQSLGDTGITVLVLLVAVAILLFQALRAVLVALVGLLMPAFALFRSLVLVLGLVAVIGYGLVAGADQVPERRCPQRRPPASPRADPLRRRRRRRCRRVTRSSLAAPDR